MTTATPPVTDRVEAASTRPAKAAAGPGLQALATARSARRRLQLRGMAATIVSATP